jgi:hypothetical protein
VTQAYLTLSEVLGHIDVLVKEGRVREVKRGGVASSTRPEGGLAVAPCLPLPRPPAC